LGGGTVVPVVPMPGGYGVRIPFVKKTTEFDTGVDLPEGMIVSDVIVEVTKEVADATIDVGLLSTENSNGGDADGFLVGESCAAKGFVKHNTVATDVLLLHLVHILQKRIYSTLLLVMEHRLIEFPINHIVGEGQVSVSYTTSDSDNLGR